MSDGYPDDWKERARTVYRRDDYTCQHCGAQGGRSGNAELHAHHITPKSQGGSHATENLKTLCADCHNDQHDHDIFADQPQTTGWTLGSSTILWVVIIPTTLVSGYIIGAMLLLAEFGDIGFIIGGIILGTISGFASRRAPYSLIYPGYAVLLAFALIVTTISSAFDGTTEEFIQLAVDSSLFLVITVSAVFLYVIFAPLLFKIHDHIEIESLSLSR